MLSFNGSSLLQQVQENFETVSGKLPPSSITPPELVGKAEIGTFVSAQPGVWEGSPVPEIETTLYVEGAVRQSPCLLKPEDDGKEVVVTDVALNDAGEAVVSSWRVFARYPEPNASGVPEGALIDAKGGVVAIDAGALFAGTSGGQWTATCAAGTDALQIDIDETGILSLGAGTLTGSSIVSVGYANSGGATSVMFPVFSGDRAQYNGSLGDLSITEGDLMAVEAGLAFSGTDLSFSATGLPEGITTDPETGRIAGQADQVGTYSVVLSATNPLGEASASFGIEILEKLSAPGYDGSFIAQQIMLGSFFELPVGSAFTGEELTFFATGLVPGLSINAVTGVIAGTPTVDGTFATVITAKNSAGEVSASLQITVAALKPALIGILENRSYTINSGTRYYNISSVTQGVQPIEYFMLPKVLSAGVIDNGDGTYGRKALTAGYPEPATATEWLLNGASIGSGKTLAKIDADGLVGELAVRVTATNQHGSDSLMSSAKTLSASVQPVHVETIMSGTNSATTSFTATNPAYSTGDLVVVAVRLDRGAQYPLRVAAPSGETIVTEAAYFDTGNIGTGGQSMALYYYIATSPKAEGANITCTYGTGEQFSVSVSVFAANTFDAQTPLSNTVTGSATGTIAETSAMSAVTTAERAKGMVLFFCGSDVQGIGSTPSGWTELGWQDVGALAGYVGRRDAYTQAGEKIASATFPFIDSRIWVGVTSIINPGK